MKKILLIALSIILVLSVTACTPKAEETAGSTTGDTTAPEVEKPNDEIVANPEAEKVVTDGTFYDTGYFDIPPAYNGNPYAVGGVGEAKHWIFGALGIWEPLTGTYKNYLAENIEITSDKLTIELKEGIVWDDGTPFTTKDIESNMVLEGGLKGYPRIWAGVDEIVLIDDYNMEFILNSESSDLTVYYILEKRIETSYNDFGQWYDGAKEVLDMRKADWNADVSETEAYVELSTTIKEYKPEVPAGYGPYKLTRITADEMILSRVDQYPGIENVEFETINVKRRTGNEAQTALLQGGQIDYTETALTPDLVEAIKAQNPGMNVTTAPYFAAITVLFNQDDEKVTDDLLVRKAIAKVIDRDKVRELAFFFGDTMNGMSGMIPAMENAWIDTSSFDQYENDLEAAGVLLEEAGYTKEGDKWMKDGVQLELNISSRSGYTDFNIAAEEISRELQSFGIASAPIVIPSETFASTVSSGDYDLILEFGAYFSRVSPWQVYDRFYNPDGYVRTTGNGEDTGVNADGETIVFEEVLTEFANKSTSDERKTEIVEDLAYITNQTLPSIDIAEKTGLYFLNDKGVSQWPLGDSLEKGLTSNLGYYRVYWMLNGDLQAN